MIASQHSLTGLVPPIVGKVERGGLSAKTLIGIHKTLPILLGAAPEQLRVLGAEALQIRL